MKLTIVGTGYVGLVTGACLARTGSHVSCVDIDEAKLRQLRSQVIPFHEPGLDTLVESGISSGNLAFTSDLAAALVDTDVVFICVATPPGRDGSSDTSQVLSVARQLGQSMREPLVVVTKSTVPVGTSEEVQRLIREELAGRGLSFDFPVVSNPEFLKEGNAISDFMKPDRIIIGSGSDEATDILRELYAPFCRNHEKLQVMGLREAEMTKYASNAMLATRISFMNEVANLCERLNVDVEQVRCGIGADSRIGYSFIYPGCGYGGSCFPKDVSALIQMAKETGFDAQLLSAVEARNQEQKRHLFERIHDYYSGAVAGRTFGIWGLAFKPDTDDIREASSQVLVRQLVDAGARVRAYDPEAGETSRRHFDRQLFEGQRFVIVDDAYEALAGADAMVLVTEWRLFRQPDFQRIQQQLKEPVIFDGRNQYDPARMAKRGFDYIGMGRFAAGRSRES